MHAMGSGGKSPCLHIGVASIEKTKFRGWGVIPLQREITVQWTELRRGNNLNIGYLTHQRKSSPERKFRKVKKKHVTLEVDRTVPD